MSNIEELKKILRDHEKRITKLESKGSSNQTKNETEVKSRGVLIIDLKSEGFFKQPRSIGEIADKLTEMNYYTKSSDLTLPLQKLVRSHVLRRVKKDGKWAYIAGR